MGSHTGYFGCASDWHSEVGGYIPYVYTINSPVISMVTGYKDVSLQQDGIVIIGYAVLLFLSVVSETVFSGKSTSPMKLKNICTR